MRKQKLLKSHLLAFMHFFHGFLTGIELRAGALASKKRANNTIIARCAPKRKYLRVKLNVNDVLFIEAVSPFYFPSTALHFYFRCCLLFVEKTSVILLWSFFPPVLAISGGKHTIA